MADLPTAFGIPEAGYTAEQSYNAPWRLWLRERGAANIIFVVLMLVTIVCIAMFFTVMFKYLPDGQLALSLLGIIGFGIIGFGSAIISMFVWNEVTLFGKKINTD